MVQKEEPEKSNLVKLLNLAKLYLWGNQRICGERLYEILCKQLKSERIPRGA